MTEPIEPPPEEPRRYGRGLFLATVAGGLTSLVWGKAVWGHVSGALGSAESFVPLVPTRRLADLHRLRLDADVRPGDVAARRSAARSRSRRRSRTTSCARCRASNQISTFHCVTGWTVKNVHWGGVRMSDVLGGVAAAAVGRRAPVRLRRGSVRRLSDDAAGVAARRDARLRDGREAAAARARRAAAARHPGDVRLQEREVAARDQRRPGSGGAATGSSSATTRTRGSATRTATARDALRQALLAHRARAALGERARLLRPARSGLILYLPSLAIARRPPAADQGHPLLVRGRLGRRCSPPSCCSATGAGCCARRASSRSFDADDRAWLQRQAVAPQGRFNAGQKINAVLTAAFCVLFVVSGLLLWLGERDTALPLREHRRAPRRADVRRRSSCSSATSISR